MDDQDLLHPNPQHLALWPQPPPQRDRNYGTSGGQGLYRKVVGVNLKAPSFRSPVLVMGENGTLARGGAGARGVWAQDGYAEMVMPWLMPP